MDLSAFSQRVIYPRMMGNGVALTIHVINIVYLLNYLTEDVLRDPEVRRFYENRYQLLTVWYTYIHMFYLVLSVACDVLTLVAAKETNILLEMLERVREPVFSGVVCPGGFAVPTVFWVQYLYDHGLILSPSVDRAFPNFTSHVTHTAVVPTVVWETVFRPRRKPATHVVNLLLMIGYYGIYNIVIYRSYATSGVWVYPILNMLNGTIYLHVYLVLCYAVVLAYYFVQWKINNFVRTKLWAVIKYE